MSDSLDALPLRHRQPLRISTDVPLFVRALSDSSSSSSSPSNQNVTPGTTPSTGALQCPFHVLCMHDFESSDPVHLPFCKDEVLAIIKQEHSGWWAAMRPEGDRIGWIPSSFVLPLDRSKIIEDPDGTLRPYESLNVPPLSAVHEPWVPVSEDYAVLSFRLVTPTDLDLYKGFFDDSVRNQKYEPFFDLPNDERSSDMENDHVPPTPENPPRHRIQNLPSLRLSESGASQLTRPESPPLLNAGLYHHLRPRGVNDQASFPYLTTSANLDETTMDLMSGLDIKGLHMTLKSVAVSKDGTCSYGIDGQSRYPGLPPDVCSAGPDQGISDVWLLHLTVWGPDHLAEQLCILMHTIYATIRQNECLGWIAGSRSTDVAGLWHFFVIHDYIASWVQRSILAHKDVTRQTETLENWIRVAEKCHALCNFDSLCAIILALSGFSSSLVSAWARCAYKQTFATLRDKLDVANKFYCLMVIMDAAKGPSVPFVRGYLDNIKELHVEHSSKPLHQSCHAAEAGSSAALCRLQLAAVSALLRHQRLPYDFKITKSLRSFIDNELQTGRLANDWLLARSRTLSTGNGRSD